MCFPVNFAKLLRTPFLQNTSVAATASGKRKYNLLKSAVEN